MATKKAKAKTKAKPKRAPRPATLGGLVISEMRAASRKVMAVREGLRAKILELPGPSKASGIKPLNDQCCIVRSCKLLNTWSADTYVFAVQYKALSELVSIGEADTILRRLLRVLRDAKMPGHQQGTLRLHPEVVENVRKMLKGAPK